MSATRTTATVAVLLEVELTDTWNDDCTLSLVHKQAKDGARGMVNKMIENHPHIHRRGGLKVMAIIVEQGATG